MKICCVIHSLDGGGAERVMASLASRLSDRSHRVTLITLDDGSRSKHSLDLSVDVENLDVMSESRNIRERLRNTRHRIRRLRAAIVQVAPDVVLSFCDRPNVLTLLAARGLSMPVIVSERSDPRQQQLGWLGERLRNRMYRRAAAVVALTEVSAAYLREQTLSDVTVIPSAVDVPPMESDRTTAIANRRILGIGRLEPEKGFDRLIDAFAPVARSHPDWQLRILGEGSQRKRLETQILELGLERQITMPGWIRPVWDELGSATFFALPSRYEGFPSALLEAMAMGVPSVAVDCESGPRFVIEDASQGLLIANTTESITDGLKTLIHDASFREQIGKGGRSVLQRFSWDAMVDSYEGLLTEHARSAAGSKHPAS